MCCLGIECVMLTTVGLWGRTPCLHYSPQLRNMILCTSVWMTSTIHGRPCAFTMLCKPRQVPRILSTCTCVFLQWTAPATHGFDNLTVTTAGNLSSTSNLGPSSSGIPGPEQGRGPCWRTTHMPHERTCKRRGHARDLDTTTVPAEPNRN